MKKISKKEIKEFVKQANDLYHEFYFGDDAKFRSLNKAVNMLLFIDRLWHYLTIDLDCWYEGDNIINEAIGTTIVYWNTDVVDQLTFIDDLEKLALDSYEKNKCTKAK